MNIKLNNNINLVFVTFAFVSLLISGCLPLSSSDTVASANAQKNAKEAPITHSNETTGKPELELELELKHPLLIKAKASQKNITAILNKGTLKLGNTEIKNWPFAVPDCQNCDLSITRRHYPDGPNTLIKLFNDKQSWLLVESWQKRLQVNEWTVQIQGNYLSVKSDQNEWKLQQGQQQKIDNCMIHVLWNQSLSKKHHMNKQPNNQKANIRSNESGAPSFSTPEISDDKPKQRIQLLIHCT